MAGKDRSLPGSMGIYGDRKYVGSPEWRAATAGPQTPVEDAPKPPTTGNPMIDPTTGKPYPGSMP
jgi:hypothetical protein